MIEVKRLTDFEEIEAAAPFQTAWYLKTFVKHFCQKENPILLGIFEEEKRIGFGGFEKVDDKVLFLGMRPVLNGQELTDYGDIVLDSSYKNYKEVWDKILKWFSQNGVRSLQLDYVREDSLIYRLFKDKAIKQTVAPYIVLPASWDEYLDSLDRVDRKELKRKIKRLERTSYRYRSIDILKQDDFEEFVRLHKLSSGEKDEFMSDAMQSFFWDLATVKTRDWKTTLSFLPIEGKNTAAIISFENESAVFAYNSGHDPSFNYYSVGLVLHAVKIKAAIEKGMKLYDFMRGAERYKYDLGGKDLQLFKIEIIL